jgi:hypothetical protein
MKCNVAAAAWICDRVLSYRGKTRKILGGSVRSNENSYQLSAVSYQLSAKKKTFPLLMRMTRAKEGIKGWCTRVPKTD